MNSKFIPNKQQEDAINNIMNFINSNNKTFVLQGYAGSGKTSAITYLFSKPMFNNKDIVFAAPTNKAVNVLKNMLESSDIDKTFNYKTIHKLFKMKRNINIQGETNFNFDIEDLISQDKIERSSKKHKTNNILSYDYIIIDECSMISKNIFKIIENIIHLIKGKIIFMGDKCQLPPINEYISEVFNNNNIYKLSSVVRYNSNILNFANYLRECILTKNNKLKITKFKGENLSIIRDKKEFFKNYIDMINDNQNNIILAYTNACVNTINNYIRKQLYPDTYKNKYNIGEKIVFNTYYSKDCLSYYTSQCETILNINIDVIKIKTFDINILINLKKNINPTETQSIILNKIKKKIDNPCPICFEENIDTMCVTKCGHIFCDSCINTWLKKFKTCPLCRFKLDKDNNIINMFGNKELTDLVNEFIKLNTNNEIEIYKILLVNTDILNKIPKNIIVVKDTLKYNDIINKSKDLLNKIYNLVKTKKSKLYIEILKRLWEYLYVIYYDKFAQITYGYCITVHKSQGSTYNNVFVDGKNIFSNSNNDALNCLYTSITRASNKLIIYY